MLEAGAVTCGEPATDMTPDTQPSAAAATPFAHSANAMLTPLPAGPPHAQSAAAHDSPVVAQGLGTGSETDRAQAATLAAHNASSADLSPLLERLPPGVEPSAHCRLLCIRAVQAAVERASPIERAQGFGLAEPVLVRVSRSDSDEAVRAAAMGACSALARSVQDVPMFPQQQPGEGVGFGRGRRLCPLMVA